MCWRQYRKKIFYDFNQIIEWNQTIQQDLAKTGLPGPPDGLSEYMTKVYITREVLDRAITEKTNKVCKNYGWLFIGMAITTALVIMSSVNPGIWTTLYLVASLLSVLALWLIVTFSDWKTLREETIYARILVEGMHIQDYWNLSGIREAVFTQYLPVYQSALGCVRRALQGSSIRNFSENGYAPALQYVRASWIQGQINYYKNFKIKTDTHREKLINSAGRAMFGLAVIFLFYVTIHTVTGLLPASATTVQWLEHGSKLCLGLMGLMLTYVEFSGIIEDIVEYKNSLELFQRAENKLDKPFGESGVFPPEIKQARQQDILTSLGKEIVRGDNMKWMERSLKKKIKIVKTLK